MELLEMGHHFVPQRYLRNFEDPDHPGYIWVHDHRASTFIVAAAIHVRNGE
jgi:hypothetical protein